MPNLGHSAPGANKKDALFFSSPTRVPTGGGIGGQLSPGFFTFKKIISI